MRSADHSMAPLASRWRTTEGEKNEPEEIIVVIHRGTHDQTEDRGHSFPTVSKTGPDKTELKSPNMDMRTYEREMSVFFC